MAFRQFQHGVRVVCMSFGAEPLEYADPLKIGAENACKKRTYRGCGIGKQRCKRFEIACDK